MFVRILVGYEWKLHVYEWMDGCKWTSVPLHPITSKSAKILKKRNSLCNFLFLSPKLDRSDVKGCNGCSSVFNPTAHRPNMGPLGSDRKRLNKYRCHKTDIPVLTIWLQFSRETVYGCAAPVKQGILSHTSDSYTAYIIFYFTYL